MMFQPCARWIVAPLATGSCSAVTALGTGVQSSALQRSLALSLRAVSSLSGSARAVQLLAASRDPSSPAALGVRSFGVSSEQRVSQDPISSTDPTWVVAPRSGQWQDDLYRLNKKSPYRKFLARLTGHELHGAFFGQPFMDIVTICNDYDYKGFLQVTKSKDWFQAWFIGFHMHMWMFARRIHQEGAVGPSIAYIHFWHTFWQHLDIRLETFKKENKLPGKNITAATEAFNKHHQRNSLMYERAIHSPDVYLASVLALTLFDDVENVNPDSLLLVCHYFREQVAAVDSLSVSELFLMPSHIFPPLIDHPDVEPAEKKRERLLLLNKKVDQYDWIDFKNQ
ncbi:uncharacterized protein LOC135822685 [Sycon ciliatum]|uniref:uncharacterized protein LOC135822685 n=1 Tax=Sycon ciliatum TaxID=27933 RepID=UPI0031F72040